MTGSAHIVQRRGRQALGVANRLRGFGVSGARAVAGLALHAGLGGRDLRSGAERERTGRVALEAAQNRRVRVEGAVALTVRRPVAGREGGRLRGGVVAEAV